MKKIWIFGQILILVGAFGIYLGCNKTNQPFGVYAPHGLDVPTLTPTPITGAIEVYVVDGGARMQGVNISLIDPIGNTVSTQTTQQSVGYAAFNPSNLYSGTWIAHLPAQSISFVNPYATPPSSVFRSYGNSTLPITVSGAGQYAVSFTTGGNTVQLAPVSQAWNMSVPVNLPLQVTYYENGNLDVPVSVSMSGIPNVAGINAVNPVSWVLGQGVTTAPITITKNICYAADISLGLTAYDFSHNPIITTSPAALIAHSYPVSILLTTYTVSSPSFKYVFKLDTTNDCGTPWNYYVQSTHSNTVFSTGSIVSGGSVSIYSASSDNVNFVVSSYIGTFAGNMNLFSITSSPWTFQTYAAY